MTATQDIVTLRQIGRDIATAQEITKDHAAAIVDAISTRIRESLKAGSKVRLSDIGVLAVRDVKARDARNPATGEKLTIKAHRRVAFKPSKSMREAL